MSEVESALRNLATLLSRGCFDLGDEKRCQQDVADWLNQHHVPFYREHPLEKGVIDFFFPRSGLGLELKVSKRWSKLAVFRQCERYCDDPSVRGFLLATGSAQRLPHAINGKPSMTLSLSEAVLK